MNFKKEYFFCSEKLLKNVDEIEEIEICLKAVNWKEDFYFEHNGSTYSHQAAYNKAFDGEFSK